MRKALAALMLALLLVSCSPKDLEVSEIHLYSYTLEDQKRLALVFKADGVQSPCTLAVKTGDLEWRTESKTLSLDGEAWLGSSDLALPAYMDYPEGRISVEIKDEKSSFEADLDIEPAN